MRKLMFITIGFVFALVCSIYLLQLNHYVYLIPICCLIVLLLVLLRKYVRIWKEILAVTIGCVIGVLSLFIFDANKLKPIESLDGQTLSSTLEVCDYTKPTDYYNVVESKILISGERYSVLLYYTDDIKFKPGDEVTGSFQLFTTNIGGSKESDYYQGNGIFLIAYAKDDFTYIQCDSTPTKYLPVKIRNDIVNILDHAFPEDTKGIAKALMLGDSTDLPFHIDNALKVSGIRHIVAVSGLHVSILFSLIYIIVGKRRVLTACIGIPILVFFAAISGFTPSVMRACIMQSLLIMALLLNREYDPPTALSFAVLVMLLVNPLAITSVSLQLSAGCMVGIFSVSPRIYNYLLDKAMIFCPKKKGFWDRIARWFAGSVSVSLGAMLPTIPLCAYYFEMVSIVSPLTNLLTLWIVSFIFYGTMLVCVVYLIMPILGQFLAGCVSILIRYVVLIAEGLSSIPCAAVYTSSSYIVFWLVFAYLLLFLFLLLKRKKTFVLLVCIISTLIVSIFASYVEPMFDAYRMTVLDVGQGQCILLQSKGKNYLVDCGGDGGKYVSNKIINLLRSQGINKLDAMIVSHFDDDHAGGVSYLLDVIETEKLYVTISDPKTDLDEILYEKYKEIYCVVNDLTVLEDDSAKLTIFPAYNGKSSNENSLCVLFQAADCDILITGDRTSRAEATLLEMYDIPKIDILVAGHHGSDDSTGLQLLAKTSPENVVISVGRNNIFVHPNIATIKRLEYFDCNIYRTDYQGTIVFRG